MWVAGEVERLRRSQRGHLYFELVEKGRGDRIVGKLDAVVWRTAYQRISRLLRSGGQELRDGLTIRCRARVDFYPEGGRLQLVVDEVDPLFTLGLLERRRRQTLATLEASGLLEKNRRLPLADVPLRLGLVTSAGSAAYHDFLTGLEESGYGFEVFFVHAAMQGAEAERQVAGALAALGRLELDAIVLVRGGGARSDLAVFDSRRIAEAVARARWPVLTGLGHEIDRAIADVVSHTAVKTPTKAAEFLVERVRAAAAALETCQEGLTQRIALRLQGATDSLQRYERLAQVADHRLRAANRLLEEKSRTLELLGRRRLHEAERRRAAAAERLGEATVRSLERRRSRPEELAERVAAAAGARLREERARLDGLSRLRQALAPERLLERGYSVTRDAEGAIVKDPRQLRIGDLVTSQLAGGSVKSRVEET